MHSTWKNAAATAAAGGYLQLRVIIFCHYRRHGQNVYQPREEGDCSNVFTVELSSGVFVLVALDDGRNHSGWAGKLVKIDYRDTGRVDGICAHRFSIWSCLDFGQVTRCGDKHSMIKLSRDIRAVDKYGRAQFQARQHPVGFNAFVCGFGLNEFPSCPRTWNNSPISIQGENLVAEIK